MEKLKKIWDGWKCYIVFTIAYIPVALFFDGIFRDAGRNFILAQTDGITQHFNSLLYLERYVRLLSKGTPAPFMNYTIGQGSDVILTLNGYDFFNPISILSVILFHRNLFFAYEFMILANMYFAGIAFCFYCHIIGKRNEFVVPAGALIYAFCGYVLHYGIEAPIFMSGVILLPVILASAELYIRKTKALPLIFATFVSFMVNYYTFFMNVIFLAVYLLIRFFPCRKNEIKDRIYMILRLAGVGIIGGLMSAVWLLPAFFGTVANNSGYQTATGYGASHFFYPAEFYFEQIEYFTNPAKSPDNWNYLGFVPIAMIAVWVMFMSRKKEMNRARAAVCAGFFGMSVPLVGLMINGFRYANNRWTYAFALTVAFAFVEASDVLAKITHKQMIITLCGVAGLLFMWLSDKDLDQYQYVPHILLVFTLIVIFICSRPYVPKKAAFGIFLAVTVLSLIANLAVLFVPEYAGKVNQYCHADEGYGIYAKYSSSRVANTADADEFFRTEMLEERPNTEGYNNVRGTSYYYSAVDGNFGRYYADLQLTTRKMNHHLHGISGCRALMDIAAVKYYTISTEENGEYVPDNPEDYVPFGYSEIEEGVYENDYFLAPAYLQRKSIRYEDFLGLNPVDRQLAMLQGAVLEDETEYAGAVFPGKRARDVEYALESDNVYWENGCISTSEEGGRLTLYFEPQADCEVYLWLDGIELDPSRTKYDIEASAGYQAGDDIERAVSKRVTITSPKYAYYVNREGCNFNLGYSEEGYDCVTIQFEGPSNYWCSGIHVLAVPMGEAYLGDLNVLREAACNDITIGKDRIHGTVTADEDCLLSLSVPYSVGWKAYVDGRKVRVLKSNLMYTALEIPQGTHEIKMRYRTPYLATGLCITFITFAGVVLLTVMKKRKKKMTEPN